MAKWTFEPGHTSAEFRVRHMMVTWVRGHFKNVHGRMDLDLDHPAAASLIDGSQLWTGDADRDAHLKSADFLDVANHPQILFRSSRVEQTGADHFKVAGPLSIRGVTRPATLEVHYHGQWQTPYWEDGADKGPITRAGFSATTSINRHDFACSWNAPLEKSGVVVGSEVYIDIDVEALLDKDGAAVGVR